eukprot:6198191-Pleurochrysis_carterae.AAC.3
MMVGAFAWAHACAVSASILDSSDASLWRTQTSTRRRMRDGRVCACECVQACLRVRVALRGCACVRLRACAWRLR